MRLWSRRKRIMWEMNTVSDNLTKDTHVLAFVAHKSLDLIEIMQRSIGNVFVVCFLAYISEATERCSRHLSLIRT